MAVNGSLCVLFFSLWRKTPYTRNRLVKYSSLFGLVHSSAVSSVDYEWKGESIIQMGWIDADYCQCSGR